MYEFQIFKGHSPNPQNEEYPFANNGFTVITARVGSGKTNLALNIINILKKIYPITHVFICAANVMQDKTIKSANLNPINLASVSYNSVYRNDGCYAFEPDDLEPAINSYILELCNTYEIYKEYEAINEQIYKIIEPYMHKDAPSDILELAVMYDSINKTISTIKRKTPPQAILFLDDMSNDKIYTVCNNANPFWQAVLARRHRGLFIISTAHTLHSIYKPIREQISDAIFMAGQRIEELKEFYKENIEPVFPKYTFDEFSQLYFDHTGANETERDKRLAKKFNFITTYLIGQKITKQFDECVKQ